MNDPNNSAKKLNKDLKLISECAYKWKISFNPDKNKHVKQVVFSRKHSKPRHPQLLFNNLSVTCSSLQKYLGILLDEKLGFTNLIKTKIHR